MLIMDFICNLHMLIIGKNMTRVIKLKSIAEQPIYIENEEKKN